MTDELTVFLESFVPERKRALFEQLLGERTRWVTVVLEDVYQEYNASACLRSCDGFGVQDVHVVERRNTFEPDGQIALGSTQWLTLHRHDSTPDCLADLRERGYRIVATSPNEESRPLDELDVDAPLALLFGTEMRGLSETALAGADETVHIPMQGFTRSFNVSVSVALCLWHVTTRLRASTLEWRLSPEDRAAVHREWIRAAIGDRLPAYEQRWEEQRTTTATPPRP